MQKKEGVRCEQEEYRYENKQRSDVSEIVEGAGCVKTLIQFSFHSNFELQRPEAECEEKRWFTIFLFLFFLSFISLSLLSNFELQRSNIIIVFWHQCNTTLHKKNNQTCAHCYVFCQLLTQYVCIPFSIYLCFECNI